MPPGGVRQVPRTRRGGVPEAGETGRVAVDTCLFNDQRPRQAPVFRIPTWPLTCDFGGAEGLEPPLTPPEVPRCIGWSCGPRRFSENFGMTWASAGIGGGVVHPSYGCGSAAFGAVRCRKVSIFSVHRQRSSITVPTRHRLADFETEAGGAQMREASTLAARRRSTPL